MEFGDTKVLVSVYGPTEKSKPGSGFKILPSIMSKEECIEKYCSTQQRKQWTKGQMYVQVENLMDIPVDAKRRDSVNESLAGEIRKCLLLVIDFGLLAKMRINVYVTIIQV